ncbi:hypothetical protein M9458_007922, partial [Cirrhinus mrigala]
NELYPNNPPAGPLFESHHLETDELKCLSLFFSIPPPNPSLIKVDQQNRAKPLKIPEEQPEEQRD